MRLTRRDQCPKFKPRDARGAPEIARVLWPDPIDVKVMRHPVDQLSTNSVTNECAVIEASIAVDGPDAAENYRYRSANSAGRLPGGIVTNIETTNLL
jgi:hypothetical protein